MSSERHVCGTTQDSVSHNSKICRENAPLASSEGVVGATFTNNQKVYSHEILCLNLRVGFCKNAAVNEMGSPRTLGLV